MFLDLAVNGRVLAFPTFAAVATGLLFGIAPAFRGTRISPQSAMKANARGVVEGRSRFNLGKALVIAQVALSLVLVAGATGFAAGSDGGVAGGVGTERFRAPVRILRISHLLP